MTQARTPEEKVDQLLTLRAKIEAEIKHTLTLINQEPAKKRSRHIVPECGTESAFQRHHHYGEPVDEACRNAHRLHNRLAYARAKYGSSNTPVKQGETGTIGATTKAAPAVRQHCGSGASPTIKESTDG